MLILDLGDLLKSIGDALLCSFGAPKFDGDAPIPLEQSAMQALQCALDVQSLHSKYNSGVCARWQQLHSDIVAFKRVNMPRALDATR